jgi:hypothetical protein
MHADLFGSGVHGHAFIENQGQGLHGFGDNSHTRIVSAF